MCSKSSARYIWLGIYNYFLYVDIKTLSEMFFGGFYNAFCFFMESLVVKSVFLLWFAEKFID